MPTLLHVNAVLLILGTTHSRTSLSEITLSSLEGEGTRVVFGVIEGNLSMWPKSRRRYRSVMRIDSQPQIVRACDSLEAATAKKASRSRGCALSPCRIRYAISNCRGFVLTVTGLPDK
jgi:hypothetical protein